MMQRRHAVEAALTPASGYVERLGFEAGLVNYRHDETERQFVSTTFINDAVEVRSELAHRLHGQVPGKLGVHWIERDFSALGSETFVPASNIQTFGAYGSQELEVGPLVLEAAFRDERVLTRPEDDTRTIGGFLTVDLPDKLDYEARTYAAAAELNLTSWLSLRVDWSRAGRAGTAVTRPPPVHPFLRCRQHRAAGRALAHARLRSPRGRRPGPSAA
jgi:iron complex outermembrane receptor protein